MINKIKKEWIEARKQKNVIKANLLSTLIGEIEMVAKNDGQRSVTDSDCISKLKAFYKNLKSTEELGMSAVGLKEHMNKLKAEISIIESFLPQQMTENELNVAIEVIAEKVEACTIRDLGKIMGALKKEYNGLYDGAVASKLAKQFLSS